MLKILNIVLCIGNFLLFAFLGSWLNLFIGLLMIPLIVLSGK